jgi:methionine-rich copper-binding protein CopC
MRLLIITLAALALLAGGHAADAHALLRHAEPPVGATVKAAPAELLLIFSEAVEPRFSSVSVTDQQGSRVDTGTLRADPADATHLLAGVKTLAPGIYKVNWHVTSVDTHKTEGKYQFTIQP